MRTPHRPLVLVIEDDSRLESAVAMLIEDWGYDCVAVSAPDEAVIKLGDRIRNVVAVVADVSVKDSFTDQRSAAAISMAVGAGVPVIATTSHPRLAGSNGFAAVLSKPYDPEDLRRWLAARLGPGLSAQQAC